MAKYIIDKNQPPDYEIEKTYVDQGYVIGVDEAGRGPWAGPVCAAAFWIHPAKLSSLPEALTDSKKLTPAKRAEIENVFHNSNHRFHASFASVDEIDDRGILKATFMAMARAVDAVATRLLEDDPLGLGQVSMVLIDGHLTPPLTYPCAPIIKGDGRSLSIAAASIIAKETRDRHMLTLHDAFPDYGWHSNQGYGTKAHQEALALHGITPHHRRSFAPIKKIINQE